MTKVKGGNEISQEEVRRNSVEGGVGLLRSITLFVFLFVRLQTREERRNRVQVEVFATTYTFA